MKLNGWTPLSPGTVQEDLIRVGRLKDPYYRDNEFDAQWVEKREWEYERTFTVDESFLKRIRSCSIAEDLISSVNYI